jgi:hypothetical protein
MLDDRSPSGVGICVNTPIPVGTTVKVAGPHRELVGIVRHCNRQEFSYFVGIQLPEVDAGWATFGASL